MKDEGDTPKENRSSMIEIPLVDESREEIIRLWQEYEWEIPGDFSNKETVEFCLGKIEDEFSEFFGESSSSEFFKNLQMIRNEVFYVYREIFPKDKKEEPFYHNISEKDDWSDHIGIVAANASRLFLGMLRLQKKIRDGVISRESEIVSGYKEKFGESWVDREFTIKDFQQLQVFILVHEAGEWWSRSFGKSILEKQMGQVEEWKSGNISKDKIHKTDKIFEEEGASTIKEEVFCFMEKIMKIVGVHGIEFEYGDNALDFSTYFLNGNKNDVDFVMPQGHVIDDGMKLLTNIFKAADFFQVVGNDYAKAIKIKLKNNGEEMLKLMGSVVLIEEFTRYRPLSITANEWKDMESVGLSDYFMNEFLLKYSLNPEILRLMFLSQDIYEFEDFPQLFRDAEEMIEAMGVEENNNKIVLIMREVFAKIFSQPKSPQSE